MNWTGKFIEDDDANQYLDPFTAANLGGILSNETDIEYAKSLQHEIDKNYFYI